MGRTAAGALPVIQPIVFQSMRLAVWCARSKALPTPEQVMVRFRVSRATAYRMLAAWRKVCEAGW